MAQYSCTLFVVALIIGFLLGRWRSDYYQGDAIVTPESTTFALDIPAEDIAQYRELVFRVVKREDGQ